MKINKSVSSRTRRRRVLKLTKGMSHARKSSYRLGKQAVRRSLQYSYRDRRNRKRNFRRLWIVRINAILRQHNRTYSGFIKVLKDKNIVIDRKILAELAAQEPSQFERLLKTIY